LTEPLRVGRKSEMSPPPDSAHAGGDLVLPAGRQSRNERDARVGVGGVTSWPYNSPTALRVAHAEDHVVPKR